MSRIWLFVSLLCTLLAALPAGAPGGAPALQAIQVPILKWQHGGCFSSWCETGWYASPAVADLNGDGYAEVLFVSWVEKGSGQTGQLHVMGVTIGAALGALIAALL